MCSEYKVTAVEVTRVTQPSQWQKRFREFSSRQEALMKQTGAGVFAKQD
jgi:formate dehydrogenase major subunit